MALVRLAGGIVWREAPEGARVALIHRPRQADWSLPKGRIDEGESWEEAAVREVEEETACEARITSFAGAAIYVPRRVPRLVLYWNMALQREGRFEAGREVDEVLWVATGEALERLDQESERRLVRRAASRAASGAALAAPFGAPAELAAARAEIVRRVLALSTEDGGAGLGPALELLDVAEDAFARGAAREGSALVAEARRLSLLSLEEPELSLRARALREESRALSPWQRRAIRKLLPADESPSPEAVHLAAELRDRGRQGGTGSSRIAPLFGVAALLALGVCFWFIPRASRQSALWAAVCGSLAGAAVALLLSWRSDPG